MVDVTLTEVGSQQISVSLLSGVYQINRRGTYLIALDSPNPPLPSQGNDVDFSNPDNSMYTTLFWI